MQRTFIALKTDVQKEMMDCILHLRNALHLEKLKWVDPRNLHITLRFLGDTSPEQVEKINKILEDTIPGFNCPELNFRGLGVFRSIQKPAVLWIGIDTGTILPELKKRLDRQLTAVGFPLEERKYSPHLTLARIKYIKDKDLLAELLTEYQDTFFQKNRMSEMLYYESILRPSGAEYLLLKKTSFRS